MMYGEVTQAYVTSASLNFEVQATLSDKTLDLLRQGKQVSLSEQLPNGTRVMLTVKGEEKP